MVNSLNQNAESSHLIISIECTVDVQCRYAAQADTMKISSLVIENFRAIRRVELAGLTDMVVIAGANGCGKTQIYNAIRLLKSTYGGYESNEIQQWWGESNIQTHRLTDDIFKIFCDRRREIIIRVAFILSKTEKRYLSDNAEELIKRQVWKEISPEIGRAFHSGGPAAAQIQRLHGKEVEKRTKKELLAFQKSIESEILIGEVTIQPNFDWRAEPNPALELLFSTYDTENLGIFEYHGAQRNYIREKLGGINLSIESSEQHLRQHALYNLQNKYSNVKSELAAAYVRDILSNQAGYDTYESVNLMDTLKELFELFFPGKIFLGPVPGKGGTLDFPVRLANGTEHDIDELSSGEKEVLFGYLRLRNSAPKNSIVMIDEPELHLNPSLIQGLPQFYHRHIGKALSNQIWLTTHSDALLREAVGQPGYSVHHMQFADSVELKGNQLQPIEIGKDLNRAIISLVGNLATYRPTAKVVFFEGGGDLDFDIRMVSTLFARFSKAVNSVSVGGRVGVERLHGLLKKASQDGELGARFYSIVDKDAGDIKRAVDSYHWDRYHIENYLIEPRFILAVLNELGVSKADLSSESAVKQELLCCARRTLNGLVRHELEQVANRLLVSAIKTMVPRNDRLISPELRRAVERSENAVRDVVKNRLSLAHLNSLEKRTRFRLSRGLKSNNWMKTFRGREVLRCFCDQHVKIIKYEVFRDLILARMREANFEPIGMKKVVDSILEV